MQNTALINCREFVEKYGAEYGITYTALYNLVRRKLTPEVHYKCSFRGKNKKYRLIPAAVCQFLRTGK